MNKIWIVLLMLIGNIPLIAYGQTGPYLPLAGGKMTGPLTAQKSAVGGDYTPMFFGAKGNTVIIRSDCSNTGGSAVITCPTTLPFTSTAVDAGKELVLVGAGGIYPSVSNVYKQLIPTAFVGIIASVQSSGQVTLTAPTPNNSGSITSVIYNNGIIATGTTGQTCLLSAFNNGSTATATLTLTGTDTIAAGTPATITSTGTGATAPPTTASVSNGTATCSASSLSLTTTLAPASVSGQWMAFGTDDSAYVQDCVNAGTNLGGHCTLNGHKTFMLGAHSLISISHVGGITGGVVDGNAKLVIAPLNFSGTTNLGGFSLASSISQMYSIASPGIAKGSTSFTAANASDAAGLYQGEWLEIQESTPPGTNAFYIDWVQVQSVSGTTVNLIHPTRMAWPDPATFNDGKGVLAWRTITNLVTKVSFKDFTIFTPMITDGSGYFARSFTTSATDQTIMDKVTVWNAGDAAFESNYDHDSKITDNSFLTGLGPEIAESVGGVYTGNTFDKRPDPINQNQDACHANVGAGSTGIDLDIGTAFFTFSDNQIPSACGDGLQVFYNVHDGQITNNNIGYVLGPSTENFGMSFAGAAHLVIANNTLAGATGAISIGIVMGDDSEYGTQSDGNKIKGNVVNQTADDFQGSAYSLRGALSTDILEYQKQRTNQKVFPYSVNLPASNSFGQDGTLSQNMAGKPYQGLQWTIGDPGGQQDAVGSLYSSGGTFHCSNAVLTTSGVDNWHQTSSTINSDCAVIDSNGGFKVYHAASGTADGPFATFWGSPVFQINKYLNSANTILPFTVPSLKVGSSSGPAWTTGAVNPTGSCTNGSLYSNTSGASGNTLWVCVASAWADLK